ILSACEDEADLLTSLERHRQAIREKLKQYREIDASLDRIISHEREAQQIMNEATFEIEERTLEPLLMAGIRMRGKYSDCGRGFGGLGKKFGRFLCGKPFLLHYDSEYKEDDADFEACFPVRKGEGTDDISVRELAGGTCVSLLHRGPYDELGRSYARVFAYLEEHGYEAVLPTREVYIKGPGMIFKGNPKKYLTEIQILIGG
ncbi:MAG: GyrI-like domain-containing protein, partial [Planctomycetes bacterium]|nr:GyrI-like domain-containing protein [Planctomycetota bacterium]